NRNVTGVQTCALPISFLHQGEMIEGHTIIDIHDIYGNQMLEETYEPVKVFSDQVAWNMLEILKSVVERGTAQSGYYPHELVGKKIGRASCREREASEE